MDSESLLNMLCKQLLEYDSDIVEIARFGSSVYAPEYSRDLDLVVITKEPKEYIGYMEAANSEELRFDVDIAVIRLGDNVRESFLRNILGAFEVLYGSGEHLLGMARKLDDPNYAEARSYLKGGREDMELASKASDEIDRDRRVRSAFENLFHAARIASTVYLSTQLSRWGNIRRKLPPVFRERFDQYITTLHIHYFYEGNYPRTGLEDEFSKWVQDVEDYISELERESAKK